MRKRMLLGNLAFISHLRAVFNGAYEFTEPVPQQSDQVVPWDQQDPEVEQLY